MTHKPPFTVDDCDIMAYADDDHDYNSFCLTPLLICLCDSAWDFPSAMMTLGLDYLWGPNDPPMHPTIDDARLVYAQFPDVDLPDNFPLEWDT